MNYLNELYIIYNYLDYPIRTKINDFRYTDYNEPFYIWSNIEPTNTTLVSWNAPLSTNEAFKYFIEHDLDNWNHLSEILGMVYLKDNNFAKFIQQSNCLKAILLSQTKPIVDKIIEYVEKKG